MTKIWTFTSGSDDVSIVQSVLLQVGFDVEILVKDGLIQIIVKG